MEPERGGDRGRGGESGRSGTRPPFSRGPWATGADRPALDSRPRTDVAEHLMASESPGCRLWPGLSQVPSPSSCHLRPLQTLLRSSPEMVLCTHTHTSLWIVLQMT